MDTILHGKIGSVLGRELNDKGYYYINKRFFIYGNMLPDFAPKYRASSHRRKFSWDRAIKLIDEITDSENSMTSRALSTKLGVLTHYLCDFFTFPHTDDFKKSFVKHEVYEQSQRSRYWSKLEDIFDEFKSVTLFILEDEEEVINFIEDVLFIYGSQEGSQERDILYSQLLIRIVNTSLLEIRRKNTLRLVECME